MTHSAWWLVCDVAAVYRLAVLITKDKITDRAREWVRRQGYEPMVESKHVVLNPQRAGRWAAGMRWLFELIICPWCIGIWLATCVVVLTRFAPGVWEYPAMMLTLSAGAGFLAERTDH